MEATKKRKPSTSGDHALEMFLQIWSLLHILCENREHFAMKWLLREEVLLRRFCVKLLGADVSRITKSLLHNGYNIAKKNHETLFLVKDWEKIESIFSQHRTRNDIPKPVRQLLVKLRDLPMPRDVNLNRFLSDQEAHNKHNTNLASTSIRLKKVSDGVLRDCQDCFIGNWDEHVLDKFVLGAHSYFRPVPSKFLTLKREKHYTYVYASSPGGERLVAMKMAKIGINEKTKTLIRTYLEELFAAHGALTRSTDRDSFQSKMSGFGPCHNRFKKESDRVSSYTHKRKLEEVFGEKSLQKFDELVDKYSHMDLVDIIMGLFLWRCPSLLQGFFGFSDPYFNRQQCELSPLEKELGLGGPSAYQLYITKDYCSEIHIDDDTTDWTLCYCSHPDSTISPLDFIVADPGVRLQVENGDLFAFRGDVLHGTAYRPQTENAAYVGAITVNRRLSNLLKRRNARQVGNV